jgi:MipA family protein
MRTSTFSFLPLAAIGLVLIPGARAADGGAETAQMLASDGNGQSTQTAASDKDAQGAPPAATAMGDGKSDGNGCNGPSKDCAAVGRWNFDISLGAGVRTDPVVHEATIPLVVIPHVSYYGKRFFIDDLDLGFTLKESDTSTLSIIATPGYDRVFFDRGDPQNFFVEGVAASSVDAVYDPRTGLYGQYFPRPTPNWTYLAGPEWTFETRGITGQLDFVHEITGRNHGNEIRAALGIPLIDSTGSLSANVGLTWKSAAIVRYYYYYEVQGVYRGDWVLDPFIKLGYSRPLSSKWRLTAFAQYEHLGSAIADSPIVNARYVLTIFAGATYAF